MGSGTWTTTAYTNYVTTAYNVSADSLTSTGTIKCNLSTNDIFKSCNLKDSLNPYEVTRVCADTSEHPNTIPVILALDVTGSMGRAATEVAKKLGGIMTSLYEKVTDIEFLIMGVGDLECDEAPVQVSQFESDVRIAQQLGEIYFEFGGGSNAYESYTAPWYFGLHHTQLDCYDKRGKKGIIITMGDEPLNPVLHQHQLKHVFGDPLQEDVYTAKLYEEASEKFDIFHINVEHGNYTRDDGQSWEELLGDNFYSASIDAIADTIVDIITKTVTNAEASSTTQVNTNGEIVW